MKLFANIWKGRWGYEAAARGEAVPLSSRGNVREDLHTEQKGEQTVGVKACECKRQLKHLFAVVVACRE